MVEIASRRTMDHATILEATTMGSMIKEGEMTEGTIIMEETK